MVRTLTCFYRSPLLGPPSNKFFVPKMFNMHSNKFASKTVVAWFEYQKVTYHDLIIKGIVHMECFWYMKPTLSQSVLRSCVQADNIANQVLTFAQLPESSNCKTYHNEYINLWIICQAWQNRAMFSSSNYAILKIEEVLFLSYTRSLAVGQPTVIPGWNNSACKAWVQF